RQVARLRVDAPPLLVEVEVLRRALLEPQAVVLGRLLEELGRLLEHVVVLAGIRRSPGGLAARPRRRRLMGIRRRLLVGGGRRLLVGGRRLVGVLGRNGLVVSAAMLLRLPV